MRNWHFILIVVLMLFLQACEKSIDFDLNTTDPKLVVEATIENGQPPVVVLTRSQAYFSQITPEILSGSFVRDAVVEISNGTLTHRLKEHAQPAGPFTFYYYSIDSSDLATAFAGQLNKGYFLKIDWQGRTYTANTRIPQITRRIDSLFWKPAPPGNDSGKVAVMVRAYDPPGFGDYIRYFTKRNREPFYPGLNSVYDDQVIDGTSYEIQVERGVLRDGAIPGGYSFFDKGDTVTLKLCNIDKATYDFWRTMEFTYASVGNPFASPTRVLSNLNGGALGYFGGYAAQYRTVIIPR